jgi:hypothetical protein
MPFNFIIGRRDVEAEEFVEEITRPSRSPDTPIVRTFFTIRSTIPNGTLFVECRRQPNDMYAIRSYIRRGGERAENIRHLTQEREGILYMLTHYPGLEGLNEIPAFMDDDRRTVIHNSYNNSQNNSQNNLETNSHTIVYRGGKRKTRKVRRAKKQLTRKYRYSKL